MKSVLILVAVLGVCFAQPQRRNNYARPRTQPTYTPKTREATATIYRYDNINDGDGSYQYNYETSNGIKAEESGYLNYPGTDYEAQTVQGSYSYYSPEGDLITVTYTADENGFQPSGDHLPKPPPIPEAIQKSLRLIYANAEKQDRNYQRPKTYNY